MNFLSELYYSIKPWLAGQSGNSLFDYYYPLTGHPYNVIVPILISLLLAIIAWRISRLNFFQKRIKPKSKYALCIRYILINFIYLILVPIFSLALALLIGHISPFWLVGFTFYGLQVIFPLLLLAILIRSIKEKFSYHKVLGVLFSLTVLFISYYATFVEPFNIEITHHNYTFENNKNLNLRIVLISDIQTDVLSSREKEVVEIIKELNPDMILLAGDYFNGDANVHTKGFDAARYVLKNISAPYGVFAVSSDSNTLASHEPLFEGLNIKYLENLSEKITVNGEDFYIVGVSRRVSNVELAWKNVPLDAPTILLHHSPDTYFLKETENHSPDLILAGHTHGGQISLPFFGPLTSGTKYGKEYAKGWFAKTLPSKEVMNMYVTRGVGLEGNWAPKIRFFSRPEVTVIDVGGE